MNTNARNAMSSDGVTTAVNEDKPHNSTSETNAANRMCLHPGQTKNGSDLSLIGAP